MPRMSTRRETELDLRPEVIRPRAAPVSTFVQAGRANPAADVSDGLVRSLASWDTKLERFLDREANDLRKEEAEKEHAEGSTAGLVAEAKNWQEAIAANPELETKSKFWRKGFMESKGRQIGLDYQVGLDNAYREWEGKGDVSFVTDAKTGEKQLKTDGFMSFLKTQRDSWLGRVPNDPDSARAFQHSMTQIEQNVMAKYRADLDDKLKAERLDGHFKEIMGVLAAAETTGQWDLALDQVTKLNSMARFTGVKGEALTQNSVDAVTEAAKRIGGSKGLKLLEAAETKRSRPDGSEGSVGLTKYGLKHIADARDTIKREQIQADNHRYTLDQRERKDVSDAAIREITTAVSKDQNYAPTDAQFQRAERNDPNFRSTYRAMQEGFKNSVDKDDPTAATELAKMVYTKQIGVEAIASYPGVSSSTKRKLMEDAGRVESSVIVNNQRALQMIGTMKQAIFDPILSKGLGKDGADAADAEGEALQRLLSFEETWKADPKNKGKTMGVEVIIPEARRITQEIIKGYREGTPAPVPAPAPAPAPGDTEGAEPVWKKTFLFPDRSALTQVAAKLKANDPAVIKAMRDKYGITTPEQAEAFFRAQSELSNRKKDK